MTYVNAKLQSNEKVLVEVGAGVVLPMSIPEAKNMLEKRKEELNKGLKKFDEEIEKTTLALQAIRQEIQKLSKGG